MNTIRLGIIGCGRIAGRFVPEARTVAGLQIETVYNPHVESAQFFAAQNDILHVSESIEELCSLVDAVYIASPHETHATYAAEALSRGVHVLCEKPLTFSREEAEALYALGEEKGCVLMEAIKTAYSPGFGKVLELLAQDTIGAVREVEARFSRISAADVREVQDLKYGGSLTEFGSHVLYPIARILGTESMHVDFYSQPMLNGLDGYTKGIFAFPEALGTVTCSVSGKTDGQLLISGTKGYIFVSSPWWLMKKIRVCFEDTLRNVELEVPWEGDGLRYEIAAFVQAIGGKIPAQTVSAKESIWIATQMETFLQTRTLDEAETKRRRKEALDGLKFWAHRGLSYAYPENSLLSFLRATEVPGLTGVELDVQFTKDNQLVVIHDEKIDRTTTGTGCVVDYTLEELQTFSLTGSGQTEAYVLSDVDKHALEARLSEAWECEDTLRIPTFAQVLALLAPSVRAGLLLNIELKNSVEPYPGLEEAVIAMVREFGLEEQVIYSSFCVESMARVRALAPLAHTGALGTSAYQCAVEGATYGTDAIHPANGGLALNAEDLAPYTGAVRCWNAREPLFGQAHMLPDLHPEQLWSLGATDVFTNVPDRYLAERGGEKAKETLSFPPEFFETETRCDFSVPKTMKHAWAAEMKMLSQLADFFEEHRLLYYADCGTLLGAVRHKGFIPWDDDIDICMPRRDYMKLLQLADRLPEGLRLDSMYTTPEFYQYHAVISNGPIREFSYDPKRQVAYFDCPFVVSIDIFPMDFIPEDENQRNFMKLLYNIPHALATKAENLAQATDAERAAFQKEMETGLSTLGNYVDFQLPEDLSLREGLCRLADSIAMRCTGGFGAGYFEYFPRLVIAEGTPLRLAKDYAIRRYLPFETMRVPVPYNYDRVLRTMFGEYREFQIVHVEHGYPFYAKQEEYFRLAGYLKNAD